MDLEDLAAVRAVVDQGTFSAAAVSLKVAQPALSRRIARLERELGGLLFDRLPRHAAPTPLGDAVASAAAAILNEVESARADAMAIARGAAGRIRMSSLAGGIPALARGLSRFQQRHPEVVMDLAERTGVRLQPRLRDASPEAVLSLARRAWGIGVLPDSVRIPAELVSVPLARAGASAEFDYVIAWLGDRTLPAAAGTLVQTLVKETAAFRAG